VLSALAALDAGLDALFDVLLRPLAALPPLASLAIVSLLTAIVMLLVVRRTSNQEALDQVKRRIHASLFEIRLFNDDLRAIFRAQGDMLRENVTYLRLSLAPMLWMIVPFVLVIAQLQFQYGYDGLDAPPGVRVDAGAVWFPSAQDVMWRITPTAPGDHELRLQIGGQTVTKTIHASSRIARRSPSRLEAGFVNLLLYPAEPPLPTDGPVTAIALPYPERDIVVLGWRLNWMVVFFVLSIVFAFALRKPFGVTL
jgi:uncharacterized membrane protein (DUF106 family)